MSLELLTTPGVTLCVPHRRDDAKTVAAPSSPISIYGPAPATEVRLKVA